jgi:SpoVK/Ycf46/Vps4 family AAA+-type ATPase
VKALPQQQPAPSIFQLLKPKCTFADLVLPDSVVATVQELLEDFQYSEALEKAGLQVRRKLLLHGPPGCGKTSIAHALADELGLKLVLISMAETVDAHVGQSEKNVKRIFEAAAANKCIVLLDEIDSIASSRIDVRQAADSSHNATVNTILTCMDNLPCQGMIIGATNLYESLDAAVRRRFDATIEVPGVSRDGLLEIAKLTLKGRYGIDPEAVLARASTPSAVVQVANDLLRRKVIEAERARTVRTPALFEAPKDSPAAPGRGPSKEDRKRAAMEACLAAIKSTKTEPETAVV